MYGLITSTRLTPGVKLVKGPARRAWDAVSFTTDIKEDGLHFRSVAAETREPAEDPRRT